MTRSQVARKPVTHIALPGYEIARAQPRSRETVTAFLRRTGWATRDPKYGWGFSNGLPTILQVNGEPILRQFWRTTRIAANHNVQFISRPLGGQRGGSGKQVLGLVALVAVAAFAGFAGPALAGLIPGLSGSALTAVGFGLTGAIPITGDIKLNSLRKKI